MIKLYLLRHGDAESNPKDFNRSLSKRGKDDVSYTVNQLKFPSKIELWSSSAHRTRETTDIVQKSVKTEEVYYYDDLYLCSADTLLQLINESDSSKDLIIIGHNPGLSNLASYLLGNPIHLDTANMVALSFDVDNRNSISGNAATLEGYYHP